jgi:hypothetical protein
MGGAARREGGMRLILNLIWFLSGYVFCIWTLPAVTRSVMRGLAMAQARLAPLQAVPVKARCNCDACQLVRIAARELALQGQLIRKPWERTDGGEA